MSGLTPYQYHDALMRTIDVSPFDVGIDSDNGITDAVKEAMACYARVMDRKYALIRSIRAMYDAGERIEVVTIVRTEMGDDCRCL